MMFVKKCTIEQILQENVSLRLNQEKIMQFMNAMSINIRQEFAALKDMIKSTRKDEIDITFRPTPVSTIDRLNLIENNLKTLPSTFIEEYKNMVCIYLKFKFV